MEQISVPYILQFRFVLHFSTQNGPSSPHCMS